MVYADGCTGLLFRNNLIHDLHLVAASGWSPSAYVDGLLAVNGTEQVDAINNTIANLDVTNSGFAQNCRGFDFRGVTSGSCINDIVSDGSWLPSGLFPSVVGIEASPGAAYLASYCCVDGSWQDRHRPAAFEDASTSINASPGDLALGSIYLPGPASPCRNTGDPSILDPGGLRSSMGCYGGPRGGLPVGAYGSAGRRARGRNASAPRLPSPPMLLRNPLFRTFVLALGGMVVVFFAVSFLLADRWQVDSTQRIAAPAARVEALLGDLSTWQDWSGWVVDMGAGAKREVLGTPRAVGHSVVWTSSMGVATLRFTAVEPGRIDYEFLSRKADDEKDRLAGWGSIHWRTDGDGTVVEWHDESDLSRIGAPYMEQLVARWFLWFGAIQENVREMQGVSLAGLERAVLAGNPGSSDREPASGAEPKRK